MYDLTAGEWNRISCAVSSREAEFDELKQEIEQTPSAKSGRWGLFW